MTVEREQEIIANLERAEQSIQAAKDLAFKGYYDLLRYVRIMQHFTHLSLFF